MSRAGIGLLDVNVLLSLLDSAHQHHRVSVSWFREVAVVSGWATCPLTENGFIRIISHPNYPNIRLSPAMAANSLAAFKAGFPGIHHFWPDAICMTDTRLFDLSILTSPRQLTDAYLAALAHSHSGHLATLDRGVPWRAVRGAASGLVELIDTIHQQCESVK